MKGPRTSPSCVPHKHIILKHSTFILKAGPFLTHMQHCTSELISFQSYQVTLHRICFSARPEPFSSIYVGPFCFLFQVEGCQSLRARRPLSRRPSQSDIKSTTASFHMLEKKRFEKKICQRFTLLPAPRPLES